MALNKPYMITFKMYSSQSFVFLKFGYYIVWSCFRTHARLIRHPVMNNLWICIHQVSKNKVWILSQLHLYIYIDTVLWNYSYHDVFGHTAHPKIIGSHLTSLIIYNPNPHRHSYIQTHTHTPQQFSLNTPSNKKGSLYPHSSSTPKWQNTGEKSLSVLPSCAHECVFKAATLCLG